MKNSISYKWHFKALICIAILGFLISCVSNEDIVGKEEDTNLFLLLERTAVEGKSWKEVDKLYRKSIAKYNHDELINQTILFLSIDRLGFFEDADIKTFEYYLSEADKIQFNRNLRLIVEMLNRVKSSWDPGRLSSYSLKMYDKNVNYWNTNFTGQTIYLEKNAVALNDLLSFQNAIGN